MKKILTVLIILMMAGSAFALNINPADNPAFKDVTDYMAPLDIRAKGMGGAGIAAPNEVQSLWYNPAGLAASKVQISVPGVGVTLYNPLKIYNAAVKSDKTEDIMKSVLGTLTKGYGKLASVDAQIGFTAGGFGFGVNVLNNLNTYAGAGSTGGLDSQFFNEVNVQAVIGYGYRFNFAKNFSLDVGATVGFNMVGYTDLIGVKNLSTVLKSKNPQEIFSNLLTGTPLATAWSVPINVGVNANLPLGFKVGVALKNINGRYYATEYSLKEAGTNKYEPVKGETFNFNSPMSLDFGVAWAPEITKAFKPTIAADFVDIIGFFQENNYSGRNFINHLKVGAEIRGLWILDARVGLDRGYWTVGLGVDLWVINIEAAYYYNEFGKIAGEKGVDALSIRINLGW